MPAPAPSLSADDLRALAVEAFVYGYPLVEAISAQQHLVSGPNGPVAAPVNTFGHARTLPTAEEVRQGGVVSPNADTLYSIAQVDVATEPLVLRVPDVPGRYYVAQLIDAWTNNFAYVGRRSAGEHPGESLLVPRAWDGRAPDGMRIITAPTTFFEVAFRFLVNGDNDLPAVHALQDAVALIPLSQYPNTSDPSDRAFGDWPLPQPTAAVPEDLLFWERLRTWMRAYPPHPDDLAYQQRFRPLGLLDDESPYVDAPPDLAATLQAAEADARALIDEQGQQVFPQRNNWRDAREMFNYNTQFLGFGTIDAPEWTIADPAQARLMRAVAARQGLFGNHAYEAYYPATFVDADGEPLSGAHRYRLHFDAPPPVDGFWSVTMYDATDFFFVDNPIGRYAIGDRTEGFVVNGDGSLDIWVQHESPGLEWEPNWLPAPAGAFRPMLRLYAPREEAFDDAQWRLVAFECQD